MENMYIGIDNMFQSQDEHSANYNGIMTQDISIVLYLRKGNWTKEYASVSKRGTYVMTYLMVW